MWVVKLPDFVGMEQIDRIARIFRGMELNEAAFRRKYAIAPGEPIKSLFDEESVRLGAARALEEYQGNLETIQARGYKPVIREVLLLKRCVENKVARVAAPRPLLQQASWPLTRIGKKRKRVAPLTRCSRFKPRLGEEEAEQDAENLDASHQAHRNVQENIPMLALPSTSAEEHHKDGQESFANFASTSMLQDEELLELGDLRDLGGLQEFQELKELEDTCDMEQESCDTGFPPGFPPPVPIRQAYEWKIVAEDVPESCELSDLKALVHGRFEAVPEEAELVMVSRDGNAAKFKFVSGVVAELFFEACMLSPPYVKEKELDIRRLYSPMEILSMDFVSQRCGDLLVYFRGPSKDWTENTLKQHFKKILPEEEVGEIIESMDISPEGTDALLGMGSEVAADLIFYRCGKNRSLDSISMGSFLCRSNTAPRDKVEIVCSPGSDNVTPQLGTAEGLPQESKTFSAKDCNGRTNTGELTLESLDKTSTHATRLERPKSYRTLARLSNVKLMVVNLLAEDDIGSVEMFFQCLLREIKPDESCKVCISRWPNAVVHCSSEAAADAIMDVYVDEPDKFLLGGLPLRIFRHADYCRPGAVNKTSGVVNDEKTDAIRVSGLPKLPGDLVKGALCELLDRTFASNSSVREYGKELLKKFFPTGDKAFINFYSVAATEAVLALEHPIKLGGTALSFARKKDLSFRQQGQTERNRSGHGASPKQEGYSSSREHPTIDRRRLESARWEGERSFGEMQRHSMRRECSTEGERDRSFGKMQRHSMRRERECSTEVERHSRECSTEERHLCSIRRERGHSLRERDESIDERRCQPGSRRRKRDNDMESDHWHRRKSDDGMQGDHLNWERDPFADDLWRRRQVEYHSGYKDERHERYIYFDRAERDYYYSSTVIDRDDRGCSRKRYVEYAGHDHREWSSEAWFSPDPTW
ncbi:hypothetical protein SELMODRAFT_402266 [Selaginella moellendorffii]|uniref:RRM domain-containing protein n=1 Tax=Selaginella moellendorffii TaxID=88036 RepID=D8QQ40_SELML|nr:hypothetical protein SELMODRAFT_402266 [Selaginella moellendorffii]